MDKIIEAKKECQKGYLLTLIRSRGSGQRWSGGRSEEQTVVARIEECQHADRGRCEESFTGVFITGISPFLVPPIYGRR